MSVSKGVGVGFLVGLGSCTFGALVWVLLELTEYLNFPIWLSAATTMLVMSALWGGVAAHIQRYEKKPAPTPDVVKHDVTFHPSVRFYR